MATHLAGQALDNLVSQFRSALDCLRELVQNSMDAGTPQVDVWLDFEAPDEGQAAGEGVISIHVDDYGSGMDEAVIDNQLTRLFASTKEDDLTKIGKFGIGFVSIFALEPRAVLLHTGRGGQYWEVFFAADRSFTKTSVDHPVEGTQITLFLAGDETRYLHLVKEARASLKRWCRHSDVEITLEDRAGLAATALGAGGGSGVEVINEPFALPGLVAVEVETEGTQMALRYDLRPTYAFFNKGLTLAELSDRDEVPPRFANISFKIKSRYLEHTLARESILRDANYEKAMGLLKRAADGPLRAALLDALEEVVGRSRWGLAEEERYGQLHSYLRLEAAATIHSARNRPILRTVDGGATSLEDMVAAIRQEGRLFATGASNAITEELAAQGTPVLFSRGAKGAPGGFQEGAGGLGNGTAGTGSAKQRLPGLARPALPSLCEALGLVVAYAAERERGRPLRRFLSLLTEKDYGAGMASLVARPQDVYWALKLDQELTGEDGVLISRADGLLREVGAGFRRLTGCVLDAPAADVPLFLVERRLRRRMAIPPPLMADCGRSKDKVQLEAAVNREHPHFRALCRLHERAPGLAAYALAKSLLLSVDRLLELDMELLRRALGEIDGVSCPRSTP